MIYDINHKLHYHLYGIIKYRDFQKHKTINTRMDLLSLTVKVGFPIAAALISGSFVFLTLKFILDGVTSAINGMIDILESLNNRIEVMDNELQKIDVKISAAFGLDADFVRIARATRDDYRKD